MPENLIYPRCYRRHSTSQFHYQLIYISISFNEIFCYFMVVWFWFSHHLLANNEKKPLDFLFCTSTSNNGNQNKKKSGKLICFFYCSLWSDFSVSCFCYVVNRPRPLFAQPWFQFIQPLESQPLWWPSPLLALALLKRPFSHSGTYFCILMFFRTERKKICTKKCVFLL